MMGVVCLSRSNTLPLSSLANNLSKYVDATLARLRVMVVVEVVAVGGRGEVYEKRWWKSREVGVVGKYRRMYMDVSSGLDRLGWGQIGVG